MVGTLLIGLTVGGLWVLVAAGVFGSPSTDLAGGHPSAGATAVGTAVPASAAPTGTNPTATRSPATSEAPGAAAQPPLAGARPGVPAGIYVATNGSDANPGSYELPLRTLQRAALIAPPDAVVWVRGGSYTGFEVTRDRVTFAAYGHEKVVVAAGDRADAIEFTGVRGGGVRGMVVEGSAVQYGSGVKVSDSTGVSILDSTIRNNRTFGVVVVRSSGVRVAGNSITGNADGIEERYAGDGLVIADNRIFGNTKAVDAGRGMEGINFYKSSGAITVSGNRFWNNGTHLEIYGASNLTITGNLLWNGQVMETGTDGPPCANLRFIRNVAYRGTGFGGDTTNGMILRCASSSLVAHNTLDGFDQFAFDVVDGTKGVDYGGSISGLRIVNNIAAGGRAFSIDSVLPSSVQIDYNLVYNAGSTAVYGNHLAYVDGVGQFDTLSEFTAATGYERHGEYANPRFVNRAGRDYRLASGSPAIDRGLTVLSDGYTGLRPDLGRYEYP